MNNIPKFKVKLKPLGDRVAVLPVKEDEVTKSGIIVAPVGVKEPPIKGTVIALGKGDTGIDMIDPNNLLKIGDVVSYAKFAGDDIELETKEGEKVEVKVIRLESIVCGYE